MAPYLWPGCSIAKHLGTANQIINDRQRWWDIHRRLQGFISWLCLCKCRAFESWWYKRICLQWASISWQLFYCDELLIIQCTSCSICNCDSNQLRLGMGRTCDSHIAWICQYYLGRLNFRPCHRHILILMLAWWSVPRLCRRPSCDLGWMLRMELRVDRPHSRKLLRP